MGLFRRTRAGSAPHPITAFWAWWDSAGRGIDPHEASGATDQLTRLVTAISPELTWHFGPGAQSQHRLTVTAGGVAAVRPTAERWLRAAPPADATWEFRSSQQADPDALSNTLEIAGHKVDLRATTFRINPVEQELRVHVGVHHPSFEQLPESVRTQVTYLVLDWLLGEDDVERWLGQVEPLLVPPVPARSGVEVTAAVAAMAADRDRDAWVLAGWQDNEGVPGMATFRSGLRWVDHPTLDNHQTIAAPYAARENGLPADAASLDALGEIESELESLLEGPRGILVGHESHRGVRSFHAYTDGQDHNIDAALNDWADARNLRLQSEPDPAWSHVRHFAG